MGAFLQEPTDHPRAPEERRVQDVQGTTAHDRLTILLRVRQRLRPQDAEGSRQHVQRPAGCTLCQNLPH
eukprot:9318957-Pyramimonas_sp.AAC.1